MSLLPPLRSLLFLPATASHLLAKATQRGADALVVDLEDSIPPDRKAEARVMARAAISDLAARGATVVLRVNSEPDQWRADFVDLPWRQVSALMLPKLEQPQQLALFANALAAHAGDSAPPVVALLETPRGVLVAQALSEHPALCALAFGSEDYAAALGVAPAPAALTWPASQVLTCAHAMGLQCWGLAASIAEVQDIQAFEQSAQTARAMGFTGALCIHPAQVAVVNRAFSPSAEERAWAARVVHADDTAHAAGLGAVLLDGRMVDRPIVQRARRWLLAPH